MEYDREKELWIEGTQIGGQIAEVRCGEPAKNKKLKVLVCVGEYITFMPTWKKELNPYVVRKIAICSDSTIFCDGKCRFKKPFRI